MIGDSLGFPLAGGAPDYDLTQIRREVKGVRRHPALDRTTYLAYANYSLHPRSVKRLFLTQTGTGYQGVLYKSCSHYRPAAAGVNWLFGATGSCCPLAGSTDGTIALSSVEDVAR